MINRVKKDKNWLIGGFVSLMLGLVLTPYVNAASTTDTALKKFESYGLSQCMNEHFKDNFTAEEVRQKKMISDLLGDGVKTVLFNDMKTDENLVVLPAGHGLDLAKDDKISCVHLIRSFLGTNNNEVEDFPELLSKLGYVKKSDESGRVEKCAKFSFPHVSGGVVDEDEKDYKYFSYCELVDGDEVVTDADGYPKITYYNEMGDGSVDIGQIRVYGEKVGYCLGVDCVPEEDDAHRVSRDVEWSALIGDLNTLIENAFNEKDGVWNYRKYKGFEELDDSGKNASYATNKDSSSNAAKNFNLIADYFFDDSQVAGLYQGYILSYWNADSICKDTEDELKSEEANLVTGGNGEKYTKTKLYKSDGAVQYCYVKPQDNKGKKVYGVKNGRPNSEEKMDFDAVAKWLLEHGPDKVEPKDLAVSAKDVEDSNEKSGEATCRNSKGAESFGWIVCPLVTWLGEQAEDLYNGFVEPELAVEPELFNAGDDGMASVREAWESFRDLANIAFIILLLVVIFSQVTGVGIDNYGIKKILPKLIVAAILINLSYLICLILIDLSNILGNGLQQFFNGLSGALGGEGKVTLIATDDVLFEGGEKSVTIGSRIAGVGALAAMVGATGTFVWTNPAILLSLLIGAISMTISIVFLFILLSVRKALIVILVTISPLAFVCFMLPNTKSLFDKWKKLFEGMLLIYPISGLLIGAGDYVSRILFKSADGFFMWITAMIVGIVPIFFLPMVIKGAFSAMGKIGTALTGLGGGASKGLTNAVRNAEAYKDLQKRGLERQTRIKAGVNADGKSTRLSRAVGTVLSGGRRNAGRYRSQYLKNEDANRRADSLMGVGYDAAVIAQSKKAEADEMGNYMTLINNNTRNGEDEGGLFRMFGEYMDSGNKAGALAVARIAGRRKDTAARFMDNLKENAGTYSDSMLQSVAKEVSTGENSGSYRASNPFGFEFASQINKGIAGTNNYAEWIAQGDNAHNVLENYVTNTQDLVGMKGGALREMQELIDNGTISGGDAARISNLATQAIEGRSQSGSSWDSTKAKELAGLSKQYSYDADTATLTKKGDSGSVTPSTAATSGSSAAPAVYTSGGHTFTRQFDGRWTDENSNRMGGDFSARVENDVQAQQQIQNNSRKTKMYSGMSDEKIKQLATEANPRSVKIQESARNEAEKRGISLDNPQTNSNNGVNANNQSSLRASEADFRKMRS